jgi:hypothetical protein
VTLPSEAMPSTLRRYLRSPSTVLAFVVGAVMYGAYATAHEAWGNGALIGVCLFIAICLPTYSRLSNKLEEIANLRFVSVTLGRLSRFLAQLAFNSAVFIIFTKGNVLDGGTLTGMGGVFGAATLTTVASQGVQYAAVVLFNRGRGDLNRNVIIALSANIIMTAAATAGLPFVKPAFTALSLMLGAWIFGLGLLSDLRAVLYPRRGIGIFFGTFNPFHITHAEMIRNAVEARCLSKVLIHPTVVPKLHALALQRGEIRMARIEDGLSILERTEKADVNVNYFPTGNRFYSPETRKLMIELALIEAGLSDVAEVLWLPETYAQDGFYGVIDAVRKLYPNVPLHGMHGSDLGGMWVRSIYDESGWIYPVPVRRQNGVSATAIRNGADGMTSEAVGSLVGYLRSGVERFEVAGRLFRNIGGQVHPSSFVSE